MTNPYEPWLDEMIASLIDYPPAWSCKTRTPNERPCVKHEGHTGDCLPDRTPQYPKRDTA